MQRNLVLSGAAAVLGFALMTGTAQAVPYAYASNQITGLTVQQYDPTTQTYSTLHPSSATTNISDSAVFLPFSISGTTVPGTAGAASSMTQAYSGPGPAPAEDTWGQTSFTGARSDAAIGAGSVLSGGVSVSNVAEAYGVTPSGKADSGNTATVNFQIVVSTGGLQIVLNYTDTYALLAKTLSPGDLATVQIANSFSITNAADDSPVYNYNPDTINRQLSSHNGDPLSNGANGTFTDTAFSTTLQAGTYNISLSSAANVTIQGSQPIPEPSTLALLGCGLLGLGLIQRSRPRRG